jgi:hypothetical protein
VAEERGTTSGRPVVRAIAGAIAALAWGGVLVQYLLVVGDLLASGRDLVVATVRYLGYFTVLGNLLVAVGLTTRALLPHSRAGRWFARPATTGATAVYILVVLLVYELTLRRLWHPTGWVKVTDLVLHDVVPLSYLAFWAALSPKGPLPWRTAVSWLAFPLAYLAVTLLRAPFVGGYPYPFLNAARLGYGRVFLHSAALALVFLVLGAACIALDRRLARHRQR